MLQKFKDFFKKKPIESEKPKLNKFNIEDFNIEDFNLWFNTIYSGYSGTNGAPGIFLRTDKLDQSMISNYIEYLGCSPEWEDTYKLYDIIRKDWLNRSYR